EGRPALWMRPLDAESAHVIEGTEGASFPFWSPDDLSIGFFADSRLKRIDIDGGSLQILATATQSFSPGSWNADGVIIYSPIPGRPIMKVPGGPENTLTRIKPSEESGHADPHFLPDGRHFLYEVGFGDSRVVYIGQLGTNETKRLLEGASSPQYVQPGYLLFVRRGTLFAQQFDLRRLELAGNPRPIVEHVLNRIDGTSPIS